MTIVPGPLASAAPPTGLPREYNFAADVLERNLRAGRATRRPMWIRAAAGAFGQLAIGRRASGQALRALGVRREERVLLCLLDTIDWPTAFLAPSRPGVIPIPVNTLMTEDDYRFMLADSKARALVVSAAVYPKFENLIKANADLALVVVSGDDTHGHRGFEDLIAQAKPEPYTAPTRQDDICFWLYTSGSTGRPKGVVHAHADLRFTNDLYGTHVLGLTEADVCLFGRQAVLRLWARQCADLPLSAGATTVLLAGPSDRRGGGGG